MTKSRTKFSNTSSTVSEYSRRAGNPDENKLVAAKAPWMCGARECSMDQHDCHLFVGSSVLPCKPARMRVALSATAGILSALAPLLIKETGIRRVDRLPSGKNSLTSLRNLASTTVKKMNLKLAPMYSSIDRCCRKVGERCFGLFRLQMRITAVELASLRHELAVDPLRWLVDFVMEKHGHSSDAVYQQLHGLIHIW